MTHRCKCGIFLFLIIFSSCSTGNAKSGNTHSVAPLVNPIWMKVPAKNLPKLMPDGQLSTYKTALERQRENCREYASGEFKHCRGESSQVTLQCDMPAIETLLQLIKRSSDWQKFYDLVKDNFDFYKYKLDKEQNQVLFTAYNAPSFEASLSQDSKFRYPVYSRPSDLVDVKLPSGAIVWKKRMPDGTLTQYDDRRAIDVDHILAGKNLEVAYMEDPLDIMRLQIEGSGILTLRNTDGSSSESGANFAGKNGFPIISLTEYLKSKGVDSKYFSFSGYKKYFRDHPSELWPAMVTNPSYTFFNVSDEPPCATARVYLSPDHTLAVDPTHVPLASLMFLEATRPIEGTDPDSHNVPMKAFSRFAIAQDTGGPIQGAHVDVYFGSSEYAQLASNSMDGKGNLFMVKLKKSKIK